ncbi:MAG: alginate export family protein [Candidatus Omnitrophica bacterium]|nr:alginate export family protein [Candidatus Omnitrophota bacterium]
MQRNITFLFTLVLLLAVAVPAFAAVENIKFSGDITARGMYRESLGLGGLDNNDTFNSTIFNPVEDDQRFYMTQIRLRANAELTSQISGELEFLNQRDIDPPTGGAQGSGQATGTVVGPNAAGTSAANDQFDVLINLANITIKELYYPELSVKIGRQNIQLGEGFIIGSSQVTNPDPGSTLTADEFSQFNSFDAIRFMVNKDAWHFDLLTAKIAENAIDLGDDADLYAFNLGRSFDKYQAEGEAYFVATRDAGNPAAGTANVFGDTFEKTEELWTIGVRGSLHPWDRLKLSGETAFQWGEEGGRQPFPPTGASQFTPNGDVRQNIAAWAFDYRAELDVTELPWPAKLGAEWVYYSGEDHGEGGKSGSWRPLFRGKFHSALREFQGYFYMTDVGITPGYTNQHQLILDASFHPFNRQDLTLFTRWLMYWLDETPIEGHGTHAGNELDAVMGYDYTEDLKFKVIGALFFPGAYFDADRATRNAAGQEAVTAEDVAKELVMEIGLAF